MGRTLQSERLGASEQFVPPLRRLQHRLLLSLCLQHRFGFRLEACTSRSYDYSPAVDALEKEVRVRKAKERKDGTALVSRATGYVRVSAAEAVETFAGLPVEKNLAPAGARPF